MPRPPRLPRLPAWALALLLWHAPAHAQSLLRLFAVPRSPVPTRPLPAVHVPAAADFGLSPGRQCQAAIDAAERQAGLPIRLMAAIARVESGRRDASGAIVPWPWSINAEGTDHVYDSKAEAIAGVRALQAAGVRSIDVGCMQVNLMHHPDAFASLEDAFDPMANATYAARFLKQLYADTGDWTRATAHYHSATPELGEPYQRKVAAVWPEEQARPQAPLLQQAAAGGGGNMLTNHAEAARLLPMQPGTEGKPLSAYRAAPVPIALLRH